MTFNPLAALKCSEASNLIKNKNSVIDMGVQTSSLNFKVIDAIIKKNTFNNKIKSNLLNLRKKLIKSEKISTQEFFLAIGFSKYLSIDINEANKSLPYDLNEIIEEKYNYKEKFNLVINNGTGEHVFNQFSLFKNMHNLCDTNGIMLHILPFIDWINHGFYSFHPIMFADLAASNDYELIKISFAHRDGSEVFIKKEYLSNLYDQLKPNDKESFIYKIIEYSKANLKKNILIVCLLKKRTEQIFKVPLQGKYLSDINSLGKKSSYSSQNIGSGAGKGQLSDNLKR